MEFIDLKAQYERHREVIDRAVAEVVASSRYILGPQVRRLEETLADFVEVKHAVGVGSGTEALLVAAMSLGLKPGDEVIVPAFTFIATAEIVALLGGKPVFVDSEPNSTNIDVGAIEAKITDKTKGIIPVDLFGQCAELEKVEEIAARHGLWVIEDAAQAFGAKRHGRPAASFGQIAITSFFPAKPLGCMGDGGMAFTDDDRLAAKMRALLNHGQPRRYRHDSLGFNARLDTLQAAVLLAKFSFFEEEIELRQRAAERYTEALADLDGVETPSLTPGNTSVWAQYTLKCDRRDELAAHLNRAGVPTAVHYPVPLHRQPVFERMGLGEVELPVAERLSERVVSLPMHPYLTEDVQARVTGEIRRFYGR